MSYSKQNRERTIEYRQEGHTLRETSRIFRVSITTIREWEQLLKEKGDLEKQPIQRKHKKLDPEKLLGYMKQNPDAYLREAAEKFDCSDMAIYYALKKIGFTRKKRQSDTKNKTL